MQHDSDNIKLSVPLFEEAQARFPEGKAPLLSTLFSFLLKRFAKHLKAHLAREHGVTLSHGQALNAVSAGLGYPDWNTANAAVQAVQGVADGGLEPRTPTPALPAYAQVPAGKLLAETLDFSSNSLIVGPAGCGKTCGLLFAVQRARALEKGRPVLIVRGTESPRYQPNWGGALAAFDNVTRLDQLDLSAAAEMDDKLQVWGSPANDSASWRTDAVTAMLGWLEQRAHLKPLVLVDAAQSVLGKEALRLLCGMPAQATVVWATQSLAGMATSEQIAAWFNMLYLMRGSERTSGPLASKLIEADFLRVLPAIQSLALGYAIQAPIRQPASATSRHLP